MARTSRWGRRIYWNDSIRALGRMVRIGIDAMKEGAGGRLCEKV